MKRPLPPKESEEQATVIQWARAHEGQWPELALLHASGQGRLHFRAIGAARREGLKAGVPDLHLPIARGGYHGLWIEMKRCRGGRVSAEQSWWHNRLDRIGGCLVVVSAGCKPAIGALEWYLNQPRTEAR